MLTFIIMITIFILFGFTLYAKTHVLIIGNGEYEDNAIQDLPGAHEDTWKMKETLIQLDMAAEPDIRVVTNLPALSLKIEIREFMERDYDQNDRLIFYYSGHGYSEERHMENHTFLVPANTREKYRQDFLVNLTQILKDNLEQIKERETLILLDSCYSGSILKDADKSLTIQSIKPVSLLKMIEGTDVNIMVASGAKEAAKEEQGKGGYFTKYLIEGLKGKANTDANEYIDFKELGEYVRKNVAYASNDKQQPEYNGNEELIVAEVKEQIIENMIKELSDRRKREQLEEELFNRYINILTQAEDKDTQPEKKIRESLIKFYKDGRHFEELDLLSLKALVKMFFPDDLPEQIISIPQQNQESIKTEESKKQVKEQPQQSQQRQGTCYLKLIAANEPAKGATIFIDGEYAGTLETGTLLVERLTKDTHLITIDGEKIERKEMQITFDTDWIMLSQDIEAQMAKRKLLIITDPPRATVKFNGIQQNEKTPVMVEITVEEDNTITLTKEGYIENEFTIREEKKGEPKRIETRLKKNQPPSTPTLISPKEEKIAKSLTLEWTSSDPEGDSIQYDIFFGKENAVQLLSKNTSTNSYTINDLDYDTQYFWQINAKDEFNHQKSPLWTFRTTKEPTYCHITYDIYPQDVRVMLDGIKQETNTLTLTKGKHLVVFERSGYQKKELAYDITLAEIESGDQRKTVRMDKKDVVFEIKTNPEKAKIIIDENRHYYSPYRSTAEWGKAVIIKVEKEGYETVELIENFLAIDADVVQEIALDLQKKPTQLKLYSDEPETQYLLNGITISDDATNIYWGTSYVITAVKNGFIKQTKPVMLSHFSEEHSLRFQLEKEKVVLEVASNPATSEIYLNGKYHGTGLCHCEVEWGIPLQITVQREGYNPTQREMTPEISDIEKGIVLSFNLKKKELNRQIQSTPEKASVSINGNRKGETPLSYDFTWGEPYQITLEKPGYKGQTKTVIVDETVSNPEFYLEKKETELRLTSDTKDIAIMINGEIQTKHPLTYPVLWGETYVIQASKEGYHDFKTTITPELNDAGNTIETKILMQKKEIALKINANINETEVYLDGEYIGKTPLETSKPWGDRHTLTFKKQGYQDSQEELDLTSYTPSIETKGSLVKKIVTVTIQTIPENAELTLNDQKIDPSSSLQVEWGQLLRIKAQMEGYEPCQKTVIPQISDIEQGIQIQINLEKRVLKRTIRSNPEKASILINQKAAGESPLTADFVWGEEYTITLEKGGYLAQTKTIICNDAMTDLLYDLEKKSAELYLYGDDEEVTVTINHQPLGKLPLKHPIKWGETYNIVASKEGYHDEKIIKKPGLADVGKTLEEKIHMTKKETLVKIDASVNEAEVYIDGEYVGLTPFEMKKEWGGTHTIVCKKEGYEENRLNLDLSNYIGTIEQTVQMNKKTLLLSIQSQPQAATVYIDNKKLGTTPLETEIEWGNKTITLIKTGYYNIEQTEQIDPSFVGKKFERDYTLKERQIDLKISTSPENANVYVNNEFYFKSPSSLTVQSGKYTVEIKKDNYVPQQEQIVIDKGDLYKDIEKKYVLEKTKYDFTLVSTPTADVFIEKVYQGTSPITLSLAWGEYDYQLKKQGYQTLSKTFSLMGELTLSEELKQLPQKTTITTSVPGAKVYINNVSVGITPLSYDLFEGNYNLRVKKKAMKPSMMKSRSRNRKGEPQGNSYST